VLQGFIQNIFLVEYDDKCMLLDGCARADFATLEVYFKSTLKRPMSDLKLVVVTHMHPDHAGCAHLLRAKTGALIVSSASEKQWYAGWRGKLSHLMDISLAYWVAGKLKRPRKNIWYSPNLRPDLVVKDHETLPGFDEWVVIETPGHTDRDLSLMHKPSKRVYIADLIVKVKGKLAPPFPVHMPELYKHSLEKIKDIAPNSVLMAHVPEAQLSAEDFDALIEKAPTKPETNAKAVTQVLRGFFNRRSLDIRNKQ
jgi:glyoxylase-like metal-dependent hydrolase (beta-lactamase superfamily II)